MLSGLKDIYESLALMARLQLDEPFLLNVSGTLKRLLSRRDLRWCSAPSAAQILRDSGIFSFPGGVAVPNQALHVVIWYVGRRWPR